MRMAHVPVRVGRLWWCVVLFCLACDPGPRAPVLDLPPRPGDAPGGDEIAVAIRALDLEPREERIYTEIARGNVPSWLRQLQPVEMEGEVEGRAYSVTFWVTPDYLAVGSDDDFLLVPLSPRTAQRIADLVDASLPTARMVDAIWVGARARLAPVRIDPDEFMATVQYYARHNRLVQTQRSLLKVPPGAFVAGHKVDVVLSTRLTAATGSAAIYGWHRPDGEPIQPLYDIPEEGHVPYNQGIRLVSRRILVDGTERDLLDVLRDPALARLLNSEGVLALGRVPVQRCAPRERWAAHALVDSGDPGARPPASERACP